MKKCPVSRHRGTRLSGSGPASDIFVRKVWGSERWIFYRKRHPIVVKIIEVKEPLSVQVHPSGKNGKTELWYILKAGKMTKVLGGIELKEYKVKTGDWIYLPGGTVHTICPPALLLEISQNNLITYRLYDWGRKTRPLDIEEGLKALDISAKPKIYRNIDLFKCPYFQIRFSKERVRGIEAFSIKGKVYVLTNVGRFSVSWMTNNSKRRRSGRV